MLTNTIDMATEDLTLVQMITSIASPRVEEGSATTTPVAKILVACLPLEVAMMQDADIFQHLILLQ